jgi:hypothetical protein
MYMIKLLFSFFILFSAGSYAKELHFECKQSKIPISIPMSIDLDKGLVSYGGDISTGKIMQVSYFDDNVILASGFISINAGDRDAKEQMTFFISRVDGEFELAMTIATFNNNDNTFEFIPTQSFSGSCYRYGF